MGWVGVRFAARVGFGWRVKGEGGGAGIDAEGGMTKGEWKSWNKPKAAPSLEFCFILLGNAKFSLGGCCLNSASFLALSNAVN